MGRVLGLQLRSQACLWDTCDVPATAERTVYLDLCLIFLLLRFSLRMRFFLHLALMSTREVNRYGIVYPKPMYSALI